MRTKYILRYILIIILLNASAFAQNDSLKLKRITSRRLAKYIVENYNIYTNCSYKIDANITVQDKTYRLNVLYRNYKDSLIWININHNTGVPVARFLIDRDSTKFLNRVKKKYILIPNNQIKEMFGYEIDFETIQAIFNSELIDLDPNKDLIKQYTPYRVYKDLGCYKMQNITKSKMRRLIKKDKINQFLFHQLFVGANYRILQNKVEDNMQSQEILINYENYKEKEKYHYPKIIKFRIQNDKQDLEIKLKIRRVKYNSRKMSCSFKIPKKYESDVFLRD